jgi:hypothetical protein
MGTASEKKFYLCRLLPPRPSFPADMTPAEAEVMGRHVAYWTGFVEKGVAIVFGPVADPKGAWGVGILQVETEDQLRTIQENDPARSIGARYETLPMPRAIFRG